MIEASAFKGANAPAYLEAVFQAYSEGRIVAAMPRMPAVRSIPGVKLIERQEFEDAPGWVELHHRPVADDRPAQISFSSGTTGRPKPLLLSHKALADVVERINAAMELDGNVAEYVGVPVTFSFGFARCRAVAAVGGRAFLPAHGFDPAEIARMLATGEINAISAVPTLWRVLLANADLFRDKGRRVRWIEIGSQYMAREEKEALKRLFPNARIVQHYGLTEASRTALLDISITEGDALESVGQATGSVGVMISEDGLIRTRGSHLADGLVSGAGVKPITDADGWLTTADRGVLVDGHLYFHGRADELINCGGLKIDPAQFEQRLLARLGLTNSVAVGRAEDQLRGERILIAVQHNADIDRTALNGAASEVAAEHGLTASGSLVYVDVDAIPRTATGKVQRDLLSEAVESTKALDLALSPEENLPPQPGTSSVPDTTAIARARELQDIWASVLGVAHVSLDENFYDLGGDSLSALTAIVRMEAMGLDPEVARGIFEGRTISDLVGIDQGADVQASQTAEPILAPMGESFQTKTTTSRIANTIDAVHATRGLLVLWVVFVHWHQGVLARVSDQLTWISEAINPLIRFGTPGFAMVFGLSIGLLSVHQYQRNRQVFLRSNRLGTALIFAGVLILAAFIAGVIFLDGRIDHPNRLSFLFYSAISYYFLMSLSLPLVLGFLTRWKDIPAVILLSIAALMALHEILVIVFSDIKIYGAAELAKILTIAKYGYLKMTPAVLIGVLTGLMLRRFHQNANFCRTLPAIGLFLFFLGIFMAYKIEGENFILSFSAVKPWHLICYIGLMLLILSYFMAINKADRCGYIAARLNKSMIVVGILALPIFVGHEIVRPAKDIVTNLGLQDAIALVLTLGVFLVALWVAYRRMSAFIPK